MHNETVRIGYQGIEGSYCEKALMEFIHKYKFKDVEIIPLISSYEVAKSLFEHTIDYGVVAIDNTIGGKVIETEEILKNNNFEIVDSTKIRIHHFLFKKKNTLIKNIKRVASHEQAIKQTKNTIEKKFGNLERVFISDTALAAKMLYEDELDDNTVVICSKDAGNKYSLHCIYKNIEDSKSITEFVLLKK